MRRVTVSGMAAHARGASARLVVAPAAASLARAPHALPQPGAHAGPALARPQVARTPEQEQASAAQRKAQLGGTVQEVAAAFQADSERISGACGAPRAAPCRVPAPPTRRRCSADPAAAWGCSGRAPLHGHLALPAQPAHARARGAPVPWGAAWATRPRRPHARAPQQPRAQLRARPQARRRAAPGARGAGIQDARARSRAERTWGKDLSRLAKLASARQSGAAPSGFHLGHRAHAS